MGLLIDASILIEHERGGLDVKSRVAAAGRPIGPHDQWLAATCLAHGLTLATANLREFERVEGLTIENWAAEG